MQNWGQNRFDDDQMPSGGHVVGTGMTIVWQEGPRGSLPNQDPPNGAFVEDVIWAAIQRLKFFQGTQFEHRHNAEAINHLDLAMAHLEARSDEREDRGVEGTHTI